MEHGCRGESWDLLAEGAAAIGVRLSSGQLSQFHVYIDELTLWNRSLNLTGAKTSRELVLKHLIDSLAGAPILPNGARRLVDLGSGAGFPGVPLKLALPALEVALVESSHKKAAFLLSLCARLKLTGVHVLCERAEHLSAQYGGRFDVAVARALGSMESVAAFAAPLVKPHGHLLAYRGPRGLVESRHQRLTGWRLTRAVEVVLPCHAGGRALILWERVAP